MAQGLPGDLNSRHHRSYTSNDDGVCQRIVIMGDTNPVARLEVFTLNTSSCTKIADANPDRMSFTVHNKSNKDAWLKLQITGLDLDKKGIFLPRNETRRMTPGAVYTGEICAIAESDAPILYVTEY